MKREMQALVENRFSTTHGGKPKNWNMFEVELRRATLQNPELPVACASGNHDTNVERKPLNTRQPSSTMKSASKPVTGWRVPA
jgi:hypothetical protein